MGPPPGGRHLYLPSDASADDSLRWSTETFPLDLNRTQQQQEKSILAECVMLPHRSSHHLKLG